uniref:CPBP family intramembrane metalloprotease n=1 Tax=Candidatus Methanomethylicus mesodigestus TaxID=1867258 RepID=A0A7C3J4H8_9CREN
MGSKKDKGDTNVPFKTIEAILAYLYPAASFLIVCTYAFVMVLGLFLFFLTPEGLEFSSKNILSLNLYLFYISALKISGPISVGTFFFFLTIIFSLAFIITALTNRRYDLSVKDLVHSREIKKATSNFLLFMPALTSAAFFSFTVIHLVLQEIGIPIGETPFADPFQGVLFTSYAALIEEVSFRLVPLAFPVAVYLLFFASPTLSKFNPKKRSMLTILALFKPSSFQERLSLSLGKPFLAFKITLILVSATAFALAHLTTGTWQVGKLSTTFLAGLLLGYCCIKFGFESAILIHWFFNSYWSILSLGGVMSGTFSTLLNAFNFITLYIGLITLGVFFYLFSFKTASFFMQHKRKTHLC